MNGKRQFQRGGDTRRRSIVLAAMSLCICLFTQPARAGQTSTYVFDPGRSAVVKTGGFAGVHITYSVKGQFHLTVDFDTGMAMFGWVDAGLADEKDAVYGRTLNDIFNLTGLPGAVVDDATVEFVGKTADGTESDVRLRLALRDDSAHLTGGTTPPPNSADMFFYDIDAIASKKYAGGTGEPNDPYQIATAADLIALGETPDDYDKHFILTADIDLDPNLPGGKVFDKAVIAPDANDANWEFDGTPFTGVFDGNDHTISRLTIQRGAYLGLFGYLDYGAEVKNLGVVYVNIAGSGCCVGGLAGSNGRGNITASYSTGIVSGDAHIGGLVGTNHVRASITSSYSTCAVTGDDHVGGLVGCNQGGSGHWGHIGNSYSTGTVMGIGECVGGLVGVNWGHVAQCYSTGVIDGGTDIGGLIGSNGSVQEGWGTSTDCFWDIQTSGQTTSAGGTGKTTAEMQIASIFLQAGWDFVGETANGTEDIWRVFEGKDYPRLSWQLPADDFEDGKAGPLWFVYEVDPQLVQIKERNGRLETAASAEAQNVDAFYVSDGWRLDATKGFAIRVDFHFSNQSGGDGRVTLGVLPVLDPSAMKWAELEAGCFDTGPFYLYEVRDGAWVQEIVADRSSDSGTLYMSYDPDADELYFSDTGYGKANAWRTVTGLLKGRWASEPVYVILGGGSEGMALTGADAWLDHFVVSSGELVLN